MSAQSPVAPAAASCRICSSTGPHASYRAREMMFGTREAFDYFRCARCGCLQIAAIPDDMRRFYPPVYGSLAIDIDMAYGGFVRRRIRTARDRYAVLGRSLPGALIFRLFPDPALASLRLLGVTPATRVLDVGCGVGLHLVALQRLGFRRLLGIDPFLAADVFHPPALHVHKRSIHEQDGAAEWDLVMYHHAFEHVPDPAEQLQSAARLLAPDGRCLLRIPVSDSDAWERYGTDWVQLDAPRHFFLHTRRSIEIVAERAGFRVERVVHDSTGFQFWGSELHRRCVPWTDGGASRFGVRDRRRFERDAARLNASGRGDQAAFVLRRE